MVFVVAATVFNAIRIEALYSFFSHRFCCRRHTFIAFRVKTLHATIQGIYRISRHFNQFIHFSNFKRFLPYFVVKFNQTLLRSCWHQYNFTFPNSHIWAEMCWNSRKKCGLKASFYFPLFLGNKCNVWNVFMTDFFRCSLNRKNKGPIYNNRMLPEDHENDPCRTPSVYKRFCDGHKLIC